MGGTGSLGTKVKGRNFLLQNWQHQQQCQDGVRLIANILLAFKKKYYEFGCTTGGRLLYWLFLYVLCNLDKVLKFYEATRHFRHN